MFLNIFLASKTPSLIASLDIPEAVFIVSMGAFLGLVTGRVIAPMAILIPITFSKHGVDTIAPVPFAIMFFAVFMGYIISPVHPCVTVTLEYFKVGYKDIFKRMIAPTAIALAICSVVAVLLL